MNTVYALTALTTCCQASASASASAAPVALVNAFIRLTFYPLPLSVLHGSSGVGYVNVTVLDTGYYSDDQFTLHGHCANGQIARISGQHIGVSFVPDGPSWFVFNLTVEALRLGTTEIRFYVSKNSTDGRRPRRGPPRHAQAIDEPRTSRSKVFRDDSLDENAAPRTIPADQSVDGVRARSLNGIAATAGSPRASAAGEDLVGSFEIPSADRVMDPDFNCSGDWPCDRWWLLGSYDIVVKRPVNNVEAWLDYVVMAFIALNLIAIGGQIDIDEALYLIKTPTVLSVALFSRFGVMPAIGLGLVESLQSTHTVFLGVLSMMCSPHEGASCLLAILADSDLTLTITIVCVINFAAVALLPLWTIVFESRIYQGPGNANIPFREMFFVFGYILASVVVGYVAERRCPKLYAKCWTCLPPFTIATVLFVAGAEAYKSDFVFRLVTAEAFFLAAILSLAGYLVGAATAFVARQPPSRMLVVSLETGCRTTYITCLLLAGSLPCPQGDVARTTPVVGGLLTLGPGLVAVLVYRVYSRYRYRRHADTVSTSAAPSNCDGDDDADADADEMDEITELKETSM